MDPHAITSRTGFLFQSSLGIWLSAWALRHKAALDFQLSSTAKALRWGIVVVSYGLAAELPGPARARGIARVVLGFIGMAFLCWPNLAYRLSKIFVEWPATEGRLVSITPSDQGFIIAYSFYCGSESFGGTTFRGNRENNDKPGYSPGQTVVVRYDPLNPGESKLVS